MCGVHVTTSTLCLGASTAFSWVGLLYIGIPLAVLILTAMFLSTATCRKFYLLVSGGIGVIVAIVLFVATTSGVNNNREALVLNLAACCGAIAGVVGFRVLHSLSESKRPGDLRDG